MRRILLKECVDRLEGMDEATLKKKRSLRVAEEEREMVQEVLNNGRLLNIEAAAAIAKPSGGGSGAGSNWEGTAKGKALSIESAAMLLTSDNFDPSNPDKRPLAWRAVRYNRVLAKETMPPNDEFMISPGTFAKIEEVNSTTLRAMNTC